MIRELEKSEFHNCEKLINDSGHVEVKAVINGNNPGRIFVDDVHSPKTGLIWLGNHDGFFFIGDEGNEVFSAHIHDFLTKVIVPEAKCLGVNHFIAIGHHSRWEKTIEMIFEDRPMQNSNQHVYQLKNRHHKDQPVIGREYEVLKITKDLFENKTLENIEFLHTKLSEFWYTPEDFSQKGMGYCIVYEHKIVSVCFTGFTAGNVHGIDIETIPEHRGNKLGQMAAHCLTEDCMSNGMIPYWDCEAANTPSNIIAEKIGLDMDFNYVVYIFPID